MPQFFKGKNADSKQILATVEEVKKQFTELSTTIGQLSQSVQHVHLAIQAYDNELGKSHDKMIVEMVSRKTHEEGAGTHDTDRN